MAAMKSAAAQPAWREPPRKGRSTGLPLSIDLPAILTEGGDREFRRQIHRLLINGARLEAIRDAIGQQVGVTGSQYSMLMAILHSEGDEGVTIGGLADYLEVTSPHITSEIGKLVASGYVSKTVNPRDRRGVLVRLTASGRAKVLGAFAFIRSVNNLLFRDVSERDYQALRRFNATFLRNTEATLAWTARQPVTGPARRRRRIGP